MRSSPRPESVNRETTVAGLIDAAPFGTVQRRVAILCGLVALIDGFDAQILAYIAPAVAREWGSAPGAFGPVFSAGLFGLMLGALVGGPVADRYGRRKVIIGASVVFGGFALATAWSDSIPQMILLRFLTGLGLGAATPNLIALTAEYSPSRIRATVITAMFCGFPLGSVFGGWLSAWWIPEFGWRGLFVFGGLAPLLMVPVLLALLPESIAFLVARGADPRHLRGLLSRVLPTQDLPADGIRILGEPATPGSPLRALFANPTQAASTLLLWLIFFMNLLVMYFMVNWLPTLLTLSGYGLGTAIVASTLLNLGGVIGGFALAIPVRRHGIFRVMSLAYAATAVVIALVAWFAGIPGAAFPGIFAIGLFVVGGQLCLNAMASEIYPTTARATGVGWALGIGRAGAVIGPLIGGLLLAIEWTPRELVLACCLPAVIAGLGVIALGRVRRQSSPVGVPETA